MKKEEKGVIIAQLTETLGAYSHFYLTDIEGLNSQQTSDLRRACNKEGIKLLVVKNTLLQRALEAIDTDFSPIYGVLKNNTTLMLSNTGNAPAKLIKNFSKKAQKPVLKAAYVEESFYVGQDQLDVLVSIKSKNELIADVIALLQSPAKNVVSALQSGGNKIHGVLKTLSER